MRQAKVSLIWSLQIRTDDASVPPLRRGELATSQYKNPSISPTTHTNQMNTSTDTLYCLRLPKYPCWLVKLPKLIATHIAGYLLERDAVNFTAAIIGRGASRWLPLLALRCPIGTLHIRVLDLESLPLWENDCLILDDDRFFGGVSKLLLFSMESVLVKIHLSLVTNLELIGLGQVIMDAHLDTLKVIDCILYPKHTAGLIQLLELWHPYLQLLHGIVFHGNYYQLKTLAKLRDSTISAHHVDLECHSVENTIITKCAYLSVHFFQWENLAIPKLVYWLTISHCTPPSPLPHLTKLRLISVPGKVTLTLVAKVVMEKMNISLVMPSPTVTTIKLVDCDYKPSHVNRFVNLQRIELFGEKPTHSQISTTNAIIIYKNQVLNDKS